MIEPLSLDEAYLDVTLNKHGIEVATQVATMIRARIKEVTHLNASAGISLCKFLAKMASDLNKPNGQAVIPPRMGPSFVEALLLKKFHGVGPATAEKMQRLPSRPAPTSTRSPSTSCGSILESRASGIIGSRGE
jgi:DNA polymerase IV